MLFLELPQLTEAGCIFGTAIRVNEKYVALAALVKRLPENTPTGCEADASGQKDGRPPGVLVEDEVPGGTADLNFAPQRQTS